MGITSDHLVSFAQQIASGDLFQVAKLGELAHVEPHGRRVHDAFEPKGHAPIGSTTEGIQGVPKALWSNDTTIMRTLRVEADVYLQTKTGKEKRAADYWAMRSRLLICRFPRLNTLRVIAGWSHDPILGSNWIPVRARQGLGISRDKWEKAMCVWLNSTPGIVNFLSVASPKVLSRPDLNLAPCREMLVLDIDEKQAASLADIFDRHLGTELQGLADISSDPVRLALDDAVSTFLAIPPEIVSGARSELRNEPSVQ